MFNGNVKAGAVKQFATIRKTTTYTVVNIRNTRRLTMSTALVSLFCEFLLFTSRASAMCLLTTVLFKRYNSRKSGLSRRPMKIRVTKRQYGRIFFWLKWRYYRLIGVFFSGGTYWSHSLAIWSNVRFPVTLWIDTVQPLDTGTCVARRKSIKGTLQTQYMGIATERFSVKLRVLERTFKQQIFI